MCEHVGVVSMAMSAHPVLWRRPVTPADLGMGRLATVAGGAVAAGARADALVEVDVDEGERRANAGARSVHSLPLLDALINLPLMCPVDAAGLGERDLRILQAAPSGCVDFRGDKVIRTLRVPVTVAAALVVGLRWRDALARAAAFTPLSQRIVVLPYAPDPAVVWEAQVAGAGVWVDRGDGVLIAVVEPEPFVPRYFKAAGWRFAERAYQGLDRQTVPTRGASSS